MKKLILAILLYPCLLSVAQPNKQKSLVKKSTTSSSALAKKTNTKSLHKTTILETERLVEIATGYGTMVAKLYNSTPKHRDNFVKLVEQGFYDSLLFHRVIDQFMIQGGDPNSKNAPATKTLGVGSAPGERTPAEFIPTFFHKKGALAAARDNNPQKASSNCQFYIVQGKKAADADLESIKNNNPGFTYSKSQIETYKRLGGTPFLDQNYTVFGEVISGLDIVDQITKLPKDSNNRPHPDVIMKIRMLN